ncbi:MAG: RNA-binding protein [Halobacteriaceae archaeon]
MDVASRHHLRSDAVSTLETTLESELGVTVAADQYELVELEDSAFDLVLLDGDPLACYYETDGDRRPFLTVRGANAYPPSDHVVTVDAGAVSFVSDGADVMRPGIVEADATIAAGDLVVICEETHEKALAIGEALVHGSEMLGEEGRVVASIHHVGDDLYTLSV